VTRAATLALVASLAACNTYRPAAALDDAELIEAAALVARLQGREVRLEDDAEDYADALRSLGLSVDGGPAAARLEVGPAPRPVDLARGERDTFFFIFTLGLWPQTRSVADGVSVRIADGEEFEVATAGESLCGWLAGPLSLLPGWSYGGAGCRRPPEDDDERAAHRVRVAFEIARRLSD
jgi:hypothetical protein